MERENRPKPSRRERLFEALFGYPLKMAEQVIDMGILNPDLNTEFVDYHSYNVETVDQILKETGFDEKSRVAGKQSEGS